MKQIWQKPWGPGTPTPQVECILKLCSLQMNIYLMIWSKAGISQGVQERNPYTPNRIHPKIMLNAKEYICEDMKHSR